MKFYRDNSGGWILGDEEVLTTPGLYNMKKVIIDGVEYARITKNGNVNAIYQNKVSDITDVNDNPYDDYATLKSAVNLFFVDALVREGCPRTIYKATAKNEITDTAIHSLFSSSFKGFGRLIPANSLMVGDVILVKLNGLFTTLTGGSSQNQIKLGNSVLESSAITYLNNRTNYYLENETIITIREIGANGKAILQGRDIAQSSDTQYTVTMLPRQTLVSVAINTTVDNLFDMTFKWNTAGGSLTVSNAIIQLL